MFLSYKMIMSLQVGEVVGYSLNVMSLFFRLRMGEVVTTNANLIESKNSLAT